MGGKKGLKKTTAKNKQTNKREYTTDGVAFGIGSRPEGLRAALRAACV